MFKMWTLNPKYIDNDMLLDMYFEGLKVLRVLEGTSYFTRNERIYYPSYFMFEMLNSNRYPKILLARYLFWISETLKFDRHIAVDISELLPRYINYNTGTSPIKLSVPSKLVWYERELMEKRLEQLRKDKSQYKALNYKDVAEFPAVGAETNPAIEITVGNMSATMQQQLCEYQNDIRDYTDYIQQNYTKTT